MNDPPVVRRLERAAQVAQQPADAPGLKPAVTLQECVRGLSLHVLHDQTRPLGIAHRCFVEFHHTGVVELGQQVDLPSNRFAVVWRRSIFLR